MDVESISNNAGLLRALDAKNPELICQLLNEYNSSNSSPANVVEQLNEVVDFLDRLDRANFPENTNSRLFQQGITTLCALISACEPESLRERSTLLLYYLVSSLWLDVSQLATSLKLLWLVDRSAAEQALREYGLTSAKSSVKLASIKELENWVDAVKGKIAFRKFTPTVVRLLRDESPEVRLAAYSLLVKFFAQAKFPAREDLAEIMKKNQLNDELREKLFAAIRKSAGEVIPEPEIKAPNRPISARKNTKSNYEVNHAHGNNLLCISDPLYPMQNLDPLHISSDPEFMARTSESLTCFEGKETEGNWSSRHLAVQTYRRMLRSQPRPSKTAIREAFKLLQRRLGDVILSMRTTLVMDSCQAVKDTAQLLGQSLFYCDLFDPLLESLAKVATGVKKITANTAHITICALLVESPALSNRQFQCIVQESKNLKPHARESAYYWLNCALVTSEIPSLASRQLEIEQIILKAVADAAPAGRTQGRDLYWVATKLWPTLAASVEKKLSSSALKSLQKGFPNPLASPGKPSSQPLSQPAIKPCSNQDSLDRKPSIENESPSPVSKANAMPETQITPRHSAQSSPKLANSNISRTSSATPPRVSSRIRVDDRSSENNVADPLSQSIADLSVHDIEIPDHTQGAVIDFHSRASVVEASKRSPVEVLRQLASASVSTALAKSVLTIIRDTSSELSLASEVGRIIHQDVEHATQTQREGYLKLLRLLDYESVAELGFTSTGRRSVSVDARNFEEGVLSPVKRIGGNGDESLHGSLFEFPSANLSTAAFSIRGQIYVDSESREDNSTSSMVLSASSLSFSQQPSANPKLARQKFLTPFPLSVPECKHEISKMVESVKTCTCTSENLAKLTVLVTAASATTNPPSSPLHSAVTIWRQQTTYNMQLRETIFPFLSQHPDSINVETVVVGLVLLRALLLCDSQPHAAVCLDPITCLQTLCSVSTQFAGQSLELDDKLLPELIDIVARRSSKCSHAVFEYLSTLVGSASADSSSAKVLCLRAATGATEVSFSEFTSNEYQALKQIVAVGIQSNDVRVRKEVYPLLLVLHRHDRQLADTAAETLSGGQKQLLTYYLEAGCF